MTVPPCASRCGLSCQNRRWGRTPTRGASPPGQTRSTRETSRRRRSRPTHSPSASTGRSFGRSRVRRSLSYVAGPTYADPTYVAGPTYTAARFAAICRRDEHDQCLAVGLTSCPPLRHGAQRPWQGLVCAACCTACAGRSLAECAAAASIQGAGLHDDLRSGVRAQRHRAADHLARSSDRRALSGEPGQSCSSSAQD